MKRRALSKLTFLAIVTSVGSVAFTSSPALAAGEAAAEITYTKHIAPIIQRSCETCHRQGGFAPMSLMSYDEVRPWARSIKQKTSTREMPPWFIEPDIGVQHFKSDPS